MYMQLKTYLSKLQKMWTGFLSKISYRQKVTLSVLCGVIVGLTGLFFYLLRMHTYYATWAHSAHARNTTCNDCHVPNNNMAAHYAFKGMDGMKHVAYFVTFSERQSIEAEDASAEVIMDNCIRCHKQLNQEFVNTGRIDYMEAKRGEGKACWDCHRDVAHMNKNSLSSAPNAEFVDPMPPSPVPHWLQKALGRE